MRAGTPYWAAIGLLLLIGSVLRAWALGTEPLWLDEAYSAFAAGHGWAFLWHIVPLYESHPPVYYSLLHLWVSVFGDSTLALRMLGFVAGMAALPVIALAAGEAARWAAWDGSARRRYVLGATGLACLSLALVAMTHEVRPYPVMILVYTGAILMLFRLARQSQAGLSLGRTTVAAYLLLVEALLWLHNLGPLYGAALTAALATALVGRRLSRSDWLWLIGGHALVALAYLPGLAILRSQAATWTAKTWLEFRLDGLLFDRVMTLYGVPGWPALLTPVLLILSWVALAGRPDGRRLAAMLGTLTLLPVATAMLISLTITPVFITRIMTPTAVPALLLLAAAVNVPGRVRIVGIGLSFALGAAMFAADVQARQSGPMQDWYRTVDWLAPRLRPGDRIYAYPNEGKLPLAYALRDKGVSFPIRAVPTDVPALEARGGWHPTGSRGVSSLSHAALREIANGPATRRTKTIWLLRLGAPTFDPDDFFLRELRRDRYVVGRWRDGPIDIVGLSLKPRSPPAPAGNPR